MTRTVGESGLALIEYPKSLFEIALVTQSGREPDRRLHQRRKSVGIGAEDFLRFCVLTQ